MKYSVLIMAAGNGTRTGLPYNKIFHKINGMTVLDYSLKFFKNDEQCETILIVCNEADYDRLISTINDENISLIVGGDTRQQSVYNGLSKVNTEYVLVHDAARPFINHTIMKRFLTDLVKYNACSLAVPSKNTLVKVDGNRFVESLNRSNILQVQTPQGFKTSLLMKAHKKALQDDHMATDDVSLVALYTDVIPRYIIGDERSIKLTTPYDIQLLEVIL